MALGSSAQPALSWCVVGQGAIGLLAASQLKLAKQPIRLWLRQPAAIDITFNQHTLHFHSAIAPLNAVLVPVKSYSVVDALHSLLPALSADAQLVLSHNGMGTIEHVLPLLLPTQGLWFLTTTHGALKQGNNVLHTGQGDSVLAPLNAAAKTHLPQVQQAMNIALGPLVVVDNIQPFLWQKLAINAVINPLTALHNCRNGALADSRYQQHIDAILLEVCQVATACGYPLDFAQTQANVQRVIHNTALNFSSMQQDISHQRRSEIEAISGYIVQQAAQHNISVPHNRQLLQQILALQHLYTVTADTPLR